VKGGLPVFRFKSIQTTNMHLQEFMKSLQEKYANQLAEIEQHYPIQWYIETNSYRIWAPSTTLAFTHLGDQQLSVCSLLHNIKREIDSKDLDTDPTFLKEVTECFVEFLFLHELKHMYQFCEGLTLEDYKKKGSYKSNPYEKQANRFAFEMIKAEQPSKFDLVQLVLSNEQIMRYNEME